MNPLDEIQLNALVSEFSEMEIEQLDEYLNIELDDFETLQVDK